MEEKAFMLSDSSYCSLENDRMIITEHRLETKAPEEGEPSQLLQIILLTLGILILGFFTTQFIRTGMTIMAVLFLFPAFFLISLLAEKTTHGYSNNIPLEKIKKVFFYRPIIGYDSFVVVYEDEKRKLRKRKLKLYDSRENVDRAKRVFTSVGLYQSN